MEHKSCGAVKPESAFLDGEDEACPDCDAACDDVVYITKGSPATCTDCGLNFSRARRNGSSDTAGSEQGSDDVLESVREQLAATKPSVSRPFRAHGVLTVVVILLVIFSPGLHVGGASSATDRPAVSEADAWNEYRTIVIFRNDDIQPNYRTETMRAVDRVFIDEDVPVTQGVIPAIGDGPVEPDGELCRYLRTQGRNHPDTFEYALHGYTHQQRSEFHGGSEFGGVAPDRQRGLIRNGTRQLSTCVRRPLTTFIPPLDTYDNATATALAEENYTVVSGGGWFTNEYYGETEPFEAHGILHLPNSQSFVRNWTTDEFHNRTYLEHRFDDAYQNGEVYVQMLHYPTFTDRSKRELLRELIDHMQSKEDVSFMTVGEFARKYRAGRLQRTDTGWRVEETTDRDAANATQRAGIIGHHVRERTAPRRTARSLSDV